MSAFDLPVSISIPTRNEVENIAPHIEELNLPTRPTKESDSRSRNWTGSECVELDSMPPAELRGLVEDAITSRIDSHEWKQIKKIEREEQRTLKERLPDSRHD